MTQAHPFESLYTEELYNIKSKLLIVIHKPWTEVSDTERTLLGKIMTALNLSLPKVQIITRSEIAVDDIKTFRPTCVISFGPMLKGSSKMYENIGSETPIVIAHELDQLDDARKKILWQTLKQIFQA